MKTEPELQTTHSNLNLQIRRAAGAFVGFAYISLSGCITNKNLQPSQATTSGTGGFEVADANHDGKLSRNEASDFLVNEIFTSRDANHDGQMTQQEWTAGDPARSRDFKKRDANKDGIVTREEAIAYGRRHNIANKMVREADKNDDGMLDRTEVQAYYASREGRPR